MRKSDNATMADKIGLPAAWRISADRLDAYADELRRQGYAADANDAMQAATDCRNAADDLEYGSAA
jgi:hypothetical protein